MAIHPTAIVEPGARIHASADIGPFCVIGPKVTIGPGTKLLQGVTVLGRTTLGARNVIHPTAVIGGDPQDLKFKGEDTITVIGEDRKSTRLNSSHLGISYAVFCLKKKKKIR